MFEKLKEYWLYIILWLIALWALAYAYVQTQNSQKWAEIESANFDAMTTALSRSDKLKKSSTVANDLLQANWWRSIWKYKIDDSKVSYVIWETYSDIFENKKTLDVLSNLSDIEEWQLRTILIAQPAVEVEWNESEVIVWLNSDKSIEIWWWTISQENVKDIADELKWYNVSAIWYTTFDTEQEAKDFRDSYFSSYEIYEIWNTWKYMILTQYNTTWWEIDSTTASPIPTSLSNSWNVEIQTTYSWIQNNLRALLAEATALLADEYFDNHETEYNQFIARANAINANIDSINEENKNDKNTEITALINTLKDDINTELDKSLTRIKAYLNNKLTQLTLILNNANFIKYSEENWRQWFINTKNTIAENIEEITESNKLTKKTEIWNDIDWLIEEATEIMNLEDEEIMFSWSNWTIIHDNLNHSIILTYTWTWSVSPSTLTISDRNLWAYKASNNRESFREINYSRRYEDKYWLFFEMWANLPFSEWWERAVISRTWATSSTFAWLRNWYHIPTNSEWDQLKNLYNNIVWTPFTNSVNDAKLMFERLYIPMNWYHTRTRYQDSWRSLWFWIAKTIDEYNASRCAWFIHFFLVSDDRIDNWMAWPCNRWLVQIRPFKN